MLHCTWTGFYQLWFITGKCVNYMSLRCWKATLFVLHYSYFYSPQKRMLYCFWCVCLSVCLSVRPDMCPGLLAHLTDFVWLTITFKHCLGMLANIWTNFVTTPVQQSIWGAGQTLFRGAQIFDHGYLSIFNRLWQNLGRLGVLWSSIPRKNLVNFGPLFRGAQIFNRGYLGHFFIDCHKILHG